MSTERGALAIVLHAHMPYVEGFGTWPFGEEWLWEAIATVYLPLLEVLPGQPVTFGLTPVLCDQLEMLPGGAGDRLESFLGEVRAAVHAEDAEGLERAGQRELAAEVRRAAGDYDWALRRIQAGGRALVGDLAGLAREGVELWAGPATHPVVPLIATDAGRRLQLATGVAGHEHHIGSFAGGMWVPECAYHDGLEHELSRFGVSVFCVDQTRSWGRGSLDHLEPVATPAGPVAVPVDWETVALVWDRQGYPAGPAYRDTHRRTFHDRMPWANDGRPYDAERGRALAREDARDFVDRAIARLDAYRAERGRPGLVCCALDAELLGHWWYEGIEWLRAVLDEAPRRELSLTTLPGGLERVDAAGRELRPGTWGSGSDLRTWDAPPVAELTFDARAAELRVVAAARRATDRSDEGAADGALANAARELLALQSSDWAFMTTQAIAADYPTRRFGGHLSGLGASLQALTDSRAGPPEPVPWNLAPALDLSPLIVP